MREYIIAAMAFACVVLLHALNLLPAAAQTDPLHGATQARFATAAEGRQVLGARDAFVEQLSVYDRAARTGRAGEVPEQEYLAHVAAQVLEWQPAEVTKLTPRLRAVGGLMRALQLPLPREVLFIKTTGREEGQAPYTRSNAIVLPQRVLGMRDDQIELIVIHELFHVISRHAPERRNALYAIVGFRDCGQLQWPPEIQHRRITNPDAPENRYCITLEHNGAATTFFPVLFAPEAEFDPAAAGVFLSRAVFRLLVAKLEDDAWVAERAAGQLQMLDPTGVPEYFRAVGFNTRYITHPEEILADNFVLLVRRDRGVRTPRILEDLERVLTGSGHASTMRSADALQRRLARTLTPSAAFMARLPSSRRQPHGLCSEGDSPASTSA